MEHEKVDVTAYILFIWRLNLFSNHADIYELSRYINASARPSIVNSKASKVKTK